VEARRLNGAIGRELNLPVQWRDAVKARAARARVALAIDIDKVETALGVEIDHT
tara:strand:- start:672 stop:833 length:162 start_codon:yes stop_codon:yes gene_type:complete